MDLLLRPSSCPKSTKEIATEAMRHAMGLEIGAPHEGCADLWAGSAIHDSCSINCPWRFKIIQVYGFRVVFPEHLILSR